MSSSISPCSFVVITCVLSCEIMGASVEGRADIYS